MNQPRMLKHIELRRWFVLVDLNQSKLARLVGVYPSVVSQYITNGWEFPARWRQIIAAEYNLTDREKARIFHDYDV